MQNKYFILSLSLIISFAVFGQNSQKKQERHTPYSKQLKSRKNSETNKIAKFSNFQYINKQVYQKSSQAIKEKKLDSLFYKAWDQSMNQWDIVGKSYYTYDSNGNLAQLIEYDWNTDKNEWEYFWRQEYTYDTNENITQIIDYHWWDIQWAKTEKLEYSYDNAGRLIQIIEYDEWDTNTNKWISPSKYEYNYDSNGNIAQSIFYWWRVNINQWEEALKNEHTYNNAGNLTQVLLYSFDHINSNQWEFSEKAEYNYDSNRNLIHLIASTYHKSVNQWSVYDEEEYTYDNAGNLIQITDYDWDTNTNQMEYNQKDEFTFDSTFLVSELAIPPFFYISDEFDTRIYFKNMITSYVNYDWDETSNGWVKDYSNEFYYSDYSSNQKTYVPDDNFEQALIDMGYDDILDDYVITSNISGVTSLNLYNKGIGSLIGIEDFTSLTSLKCTENILTSLDLSQNKALTELVCSDNQLTNLDISQNVELTLLICHNNQLTSLDVSRNTGLIGLDCWWNNLTELDVSQNVSLTELGCGFNEITNLDVSQNTALTALGCSSNQITSLDISQNTALKELGCNDNQLNTLDISKNVAIELLWCNDNQLIRLNLKNGNNSILTNFQAYTNFQLTCIQVDNQTDANSGVAPYNNWNKDAIATYSEDCSSSNSDNMVLTTGLANQNTNIQIRTIITDAGFTIQNEDIPNINETAMTDKKVLALFNGGQTWNGTQLFSNSQANEIVNFIQYGGLLYISSRKGYDNVLSQLGVAVSGNDGDGSGFDWPLIELTATKFVSHPITENLSSIVGDVGSNFVVDGNWTTIGEESNGTDLLAIRNYGLGKVVLWYGQRSFRDPGSTNNVYETDITEGSNTLFFTNLFNFFSDSTLSVDTIENLSFNIYPNPVSSILTIDSKLPITKIEVFSILGQRVKQVNSDFNSVSTENLSRGVYLVHIYSEMGNTIRKLIKE